jgi:hypothetical protein
MNISLAARISRRSGWQTGRRLSLRCAGQRAAAVTARGSNAAASIGFPGTTNT